MRLSIALHALRRGHNLHMRRVTVPLFDATAEGVLVDCSCGKGWAL